MIARRGFTLLEMVISLTVMTVLMASIAATSILAARSLNAGSNPAAIATQTTDAAQQFSSDVRNALSFTERTDKAITLTVADRNNDGISEKIRYAWSGVAGDPLTRSYNGGTPVSIADNVRSLSFNYLIESVGPPPVSESGEVVISSHDDLPGGSFKDYSMDKDSWCAETFTPMSMPVNAISWKITHVKIMAKQNSPAAESLAVELHAVDAANKPTAPILANTTIAESSLPISYAWTDVTLGPLANLDPNKKYAIEIRQITNSGNAAKIQYESGVTETDNLWTTTSNGGGSWATPSNSNHMRYIVYGTVATP